MITIFTLVGACFGAPVIAMAWFALILAGS